MPHANHTSFGHTLFITLIMVEWMPDTAAGQDIEQQIYRHLPTACRH
jgi:hypothetical protein